VNDGSTDGTETLLKEYEKKAPCKLKWYNLIHGGTASALNFGVKNSDGEIICITGDDCIADKNWIKNMVNCFSNDKIGGVGGRIIGYELITLAQKFVEKSKFHDQERMINIFIIGGNSAYRKKYLKRHRRI
jgi:glycosyltransferase involved in cell wall biosynthesis